MFISLMPGLYRPKAVEFSIAALSYAILFAITVRLTYLLASTATPTILQKTHTMNHKASRYAVTDVQMSIGRSINNRSEVVGRGTKPHTGGVIFLWVKGSIREIGTLPGKKGGDAGAINAVGHIAGRANNGTNRGLDTAVLYRDGKMMQLLPDRRISAANGINDADQIVGLMEVGKRMLFSPIIHPFLWDKGHAVDLGTFGGSYGEAVNVNARGDVVGYATDAIGMSHAFLWKNGRLLDLVPGQSSQGNGINDAGQVTGHYTTSDRQSLGFVWSNGTLRTLPTLSGRPQFVRRNSEVLISQELRLI